MDIDTFQVPRQFDYLATFLWAVSGALLAGRKDYDITGVVVIALVSSTGGGLIRDGMLLQAGPPALLRTPAYLAIAAAAVLLVIALGRHLRKARSLDMAIGIADAFGLGAYAVVGMQLAALYELSAYSMAVVGILNAVGGGLLRDVLMRQEPQLFQPGTLNALAALPACIAYLAMTRLLGVGAEVAGWCAVAVAFLVRVASVRLDIRTRALRSLSTTKPPDSGQPGDRGGGSS